MRLSPSVNWRRVCKLLADSVANSGAPTSTRQSRDQEFANPRLCQRPLAADALCRAASADLILAPATSPFLRALPGLAHRLNGRVDTHVTSIQVVDGELCATRWFYRRAHRGCISARICARGSCCSIPDVTRRIAGPREKQPLKRSPWLCLPRPGATTIAGIRAPKSDSQTIRPDAALLFVAGAG